MNPQVISALIGAISGLTTAIIILLATNFFQRRESQQKEKLRVTRELEGLRIRLCQDICTEYDSKVHHLYDQFKWHFFFAKKDTAASDFHRDQAIRWNKKSEDWVSNVRDDVAELNKVLTGVSVIFRNNSDIQSRIEKIIDYEFTDVRFPGSEFTFDELEKWKASEIKRIRDEVSTSYDKPMKDLANRLKEEV